MQGFCSFCFLQKTPVFVTFHYRPACHQQEISRGTTLRPNAAQQERCCSTVSLPKVRHGRRFKACREWTRTTWSALESPRFEMCSGSLWRGLLCWWQLSPCVDNCWDLSRKAVHLCIFKLSPSCLANFITQQLSGVILMRDWNLSDFFDFFLVPMWDNNYCLAVQRGQSWRVETLRWAQPSRHTISNSVIQHSFNIQRTSKELRFFNEC